MTQRRPFRVSSKLDILLFVFITVIIVLFALLSTKCNVGSTSSDKIPDAQLRIWMKGSDFHCCGIDSVIVDLDGERLGYLRNKGYGSEWTVELKEYVFAGQHNLRAESNAKPNGTKETWNKYFVIAGGQTTAQVRLECISTWCGQ